MIKTTCTILFTNNIVRVSGIEPELSLWKGDLLPLEQTSVQYMRIELMSSPWQRDILPL